MIVNKYNLEAPNVESDLPGAVITSNSMNIKMLTPNIGTFGKRLFNIDNTPVNWNYGDTVTSFFSDGVVTQQNPVSLFINGTNIKDNFIIISKAENDWYSDTQEDNIIYIDHLTGKIKLPGPIYWGRYNSTLFDRFSKSDVGKFEKQYEYGVSSNIQLQGSTYKSKFNNLFYFDWYHTSRYVDLGTKVFVNKQIKTSAISFWVYKPSWDGNDVEFDLLLKEDETLKIKFNGQRIINSKTGFHPEIPGKEIIGLSNKDEWAHFYIKLSVDADLPHPDNAGEFNTFQIYGNGIFLDSTTIDLFDISMMDQIGIKFRSGYNGGRGLIQNIKIWENNGFDPLTLYNYENVGVNNYDYIFPTINKIETITGGFTYKDTSSDIELTINSNPKVENIEVPQNEDNVWFFNKEKKIGFIDENINPINIIPDGRLDRSVNPLIDRVLYDSVNRESGDIVDGGAGSIELATGRVVRLFHDDINVAIEGENPIEGELNLAVYNKDLSIKENHFPTKDKMFIDLNDGQFAIPGPIHCNKLNNLSLTPKVNIADEVIHEGFYADLKINSDGGKFNDEPYLYQNKYGEFKGYRTSNIFPIGYQYMPRGTMSFWVKYESNATVEYFMECGIVNAGFQTSLRNSNIDGSTARIEINNMPEATKKAFNVDWTDWTHVYVIWDEDQLDTGETVKVIINNQYSLFSSQNINKNEENKNLYIKLAAYAPLKSYHNVRVGISNLQIWQDVIDNIIDENDLGSNWIYNDGAGVEECAHEIYGPGSGYLPNLKGSYIVPPNVGAEIIKVKGI